MDGIILIVHLTGEIDSHNVDEVERHIVASIDRRRPVTLVLDLEGVTHLDTGGLQAIVRCWRRMQDSGGRFVLAAASASDRGLLNRTGLRSRLDAYATMDEARRRLAG